ncbi:MAG TPA: glycosyltransferase family 39 protein [Acidimicrobiales bacterium]|nr:glycosyltransferase family 39 protein [Acidimicrobiales bacterium]
MRTLVATEPDEGDADAGDNPPEPPPAPSLPPWITTSVLVGITALGIVLRFVSTSKLWLDEALSANISHLPVGDLLEALKHDGHPPLYYLLLHYWMELFGEGDVAVRALSGVIGVATLPLAWIAGRRLGGPTAARWALVVVALSPYCVRYSSETRMYALVMLLVLAGYLVLSDALRAPTLLRLGGLAVLSGLLLLSHYWSMWLLGSVGLLLLLRWWRGPADERPATVRVIVAIAAGGLLFLPWLPSFLYQAEHTGTPWAGPMRPPSIPAVMLMDLGGGVNLYEAMLYGFVLLLGCLLALFVVQARGHEVVLDLRTTPLVRPLLAVTVLTLAVGAITAYPTGATFQSRYAAVVVPFVLVATAVGLTLLPGVARMALGVTLVGLSGLGIAWNNYFERTQAPELTAQIEAHSGPGDVVVFCPDQLGPGFSRDLPDGLQMVSYPSLDDPSRVDWVDYAERQAAADPVRIADEVRDLAAGNDVFLVWVDGYETFGDQCQDLRGELAETGFAEDLVISNTERYFEPAYLTRISPTP